MDGSQPSQPTFDKIKTPSLQLPLLSEERELNSELIHSEMNLIRTRSCAHNLKVISATARVTRAAKPISTSGCRSKEGISVSLCTSTNPTAWTKILAERLARPFNIFHQTERIALRSVERSLRFFPSSTGHRIVEGKFSRGLMSN